MVLVWTVVEAQLTQRSHPTLEDSGSNPDISNFIEDFFLTNELQDYIY